MVKVSGKERCLRVGGAVLTVSGVFLGLEVAFHRKTSVIETPQPPKPIEITAPPGFLDHLGRRYLNLDFPHETPELETTEEIFPQVEPGIVIIKFKEGKKASVLKGLKGMEVSIKGELGKGSKILALSIPKGQETEVLAQLARDPQVEWAERNPIYQISPTESWEAPGETKGIIGKSFDQWDLEAVRAAGAWEVAGLPQEIVTIAVLDTGVFKDHPELSSLVEGDEDDNGHGTYIAGKIITNGVGIDGVANEGVKILSLKVLDRNGRGSAWSLAGGIIEAADKGARVIVIAASGLLPSQAIEQALIHAKEKEALVVASVGNGRVLGAYRQDNSVEYPAYYAYNGLVFAVGATTRKERLASYSGVGDPLSAVAPGGELVWDAQEQRFVLEEQIISTRPYCSLEPRPTHCSDSGYDTDVGTSPSAAEVGGLAALILSRNPNLTPREVAQIILQTAKDLGESGVDRRMGHGQIDAKRAVELALGERGEIKIQIMETNSGKPVTRGIVLIKKGGRTVLEYLLPESADPDDSWITLAPGEYEITVKKPLYTSETVPVSVTSGNQTEVEVSLRSPRIEIKRQENEELLFIHPENYPLIITNTGQETLIAQLCLRKKELGPILGFSDNVWALEYDTDLRRVAESVLGLPLEYYFPYPSWGFNQRVQELLTQGKAAQVVLLTENTVMADIDWESLSSLVNQGAGIILNTVNVDQFNRALLRSMGIEKSLDFLAPEPARPVFWWQEHPILEGISPFEKMIATSTDHGDFLTPNPLGLALGGFKPTPEEGEASLIVVDQEGNPHRVLASFKIADGVMAAGLEFRPNVLELWREMTKFALCHKIPGVFLSESSLTLFPGESQRVDLIFDHRPFKEARGKFGPDSARNQGLPEKAKLYVLILTNDPSQQVILAPFPPVPFSRLK